MGMIGKFWYNFWALITILPFIGFILVYGVVFFLKRQHRLAIHWSITITNILLIHAVATTYGVIWPEAWSAWWWIVLVMLGIAGLLGWLQLKVKGKISVKKIGFSTWRLTFVLFGLAYIFLLGTGIWKTMQQG